MYKNRWYLLLLFLVGTACIFYSYQVFSATWSISKHTLAVKAEIVDQKVVKLGYNQYQIQVTCRYILDKKTYLSTRKLEQNYLNPWTAESKMRSLFSEPSMLIFLDPKDHRDILLDRSLPIKEGVYTLILLGIWVYFFLLGLRVQNYYKDSE